MTIGIAEASHLPHNALYFILLPILLYDATQQIDWYYFLKNLRNGCFLAITGIVLQVLLIGFLMSLVGGQLHLSFAAWVMISAGVGATDPIAVLSVLENMDAPKQLSSLFDCESLINDGSAVFLFQFFRSMARGDGFGWREASMEFFRLLLLGPIVGLAFALVLYRCVRHFRFHVYDVSLLIIGVAYIVFFVSEIYVRTSGPIAIVVYGLYFKAYGRAGLDHNADITHKIFVKGLGVGATSLVFIITGITCVRIFWDSFDGANNLVVPSLAITQPSNDHISNFSSLLIWHLPLFYIFCHIARGAMVIVFAPLISRDLGSFSWKEAVLLWWGGLRGGVCLIIALLIEQDESIPQRIRSLAALYLASTTVLILLINGTTFELLFKLLQPYEQNPFKALYLLKVLKFIDTEFEEEARLLQDHWLFKGTDVLNQSKNLIPRLGNVVVSSARGLHFSTVSVRKVLNKTCVAQCSLRQEDIPSNPSPLTEVVVDSSSLEGPICTQPKFLPESSDNSSAAAMSSSIISITSQRANSRIQNLSSFRIDWKADHTPTAELFTDDLQDPLLQSHNSPSYTSTLVKQPLYRVAAYSGGYTYRNRTEQRPASKPIPRWTESAGSCADESEAASPESSWSTHFLGPTHCGMIGGPDHSVLSPNAALKIKTVLTWEREGEVSVMVMNSARHLYRRMYEQSFISGNNYMNFMAVGDLVNDFCVSRGNPGKQKTWHRLIRRTCMMEKRLLTQFDVELQKDLLVRTGLKKLLIRKLHPSIWNGC